MDRHTNHNSKKMTILNQFLELNIAMAILKINEGLDLITEMGT